MFFKYSRKIKLILISQIESNLFNTLEALSKPVNYQWTLPMEHLNQGCGYTVYRSNIGKKRQIERCKVVDASDRVQVFLNEEPIVTQLKKEIGTEFSMNLEKESNLLHVMVENMGRVNYGHRFIAPTQNKGIRNGVMLDLHFQSNWDHFSLDLRNISDVDYSKSYTGNGPGFFKFEFVAEEIADTFLDMKGFGKGTAFINGFNLGRYWEIGRINYLYVPAGLIQPGQNEIVIFETEGKHAESLTLRDHPVYVSLD